MAEWLVIGVSGVTCSGKTTLAKNLYKHFKESLNNVNYIRPELQLGRVHLLSQDEYFWPVDSPKHTWVEQLKHINWEIITSLDMERMCKDIMEILGPKFLLHHTKSMEQSMQIDDNLFSDHFAPSSSSTLQSTSLSTVAIDFSMNQREKKSAGHKLNILILEGFLIFNHPFTFDLCNIKYHLHLPYEKCYERRKLRVYNPPDVLAYFEMIVWPMYDKHFKEFMDRSDIIYLNGEVPREKIINYVINSIKEQI